MIGMAFFLQFIAEQRSPRSKVRLMIRRDAGSSIGDLAPVSVVPGKRCVPLCPGQLCLARRDNAFIVRSSERFRKSVTWMAWIIM